MEFAEENAVNQAAYKRLRAEIDATYPKGRFVLLGGGAIIADTATANEALDKVQELGWDPRKTMLVIAGDDTPEYIEFISVQFLD